MEAISCVSFSNKEAVLLCSVPGEVETYSLCSRLNQSLSSGKRTLPANSPLLSALAGLACTELGPTSAAPKETNGMSLRRILPLHVHPVLLRTVHAANIRRTLSLSMRNDGHGSWPELAKRARGHIINQARPPATYSRTPTHAPNPQRATRRRRQPVTP